MSKLPSTQSNKPKALLVYLTPLVVFAFSFGCEQILAADAEKDLEKKSAQAKTSFFISTANIVPSNVQPATSGVKLLEGIFLKLRNQPQLAFGNSRAQNLLQSAAMANVGGKDASSATDQLLAIRPAERGGRGARFDYTPNQYAMPQPAGHRLAPALASAGNAPTLQAATNGTIGSQGADARVKPLSTSIQNLAGAAGALQDLTQNNEPANIRSYGAYTQAARARQMKTLDERAFSNERGQLVASAPMITEFKSNAVASDMRRVQAESAPYSSSFSQAKGLVSPARDVRAKKSDASSGASVASEEVSAAATASPATMAPASPGLFKNIREISKQEKFSDGSGIKEMFDDRQVDKVDKVDKASKANKANNADSFDKKQIALLPPSIVSGVPLVHLGASALQIKQSLGSKVKIDKQMIEDWTVWSVSGHNRTECALQLYFKHGVVEAIRVFDASYLGPDLGIKLGSDLQTIKEKFGEPAFILPEPTAARGVETGKNYIYPISQVSFALARSRDRAKPAPQVVSMLIFNVK